MTILAYSTPVCGFGLAAAFAIIQYSLPTAFVALAATSNAGPVKTNENF